MDDIENEWGGTVERLGVLGELLPAPCLRPTRGWGGSFANWLADLHAAGGLTDEEYATARSWLMDWDRVAPMVSSEWDTDSDNLQARVESPQRQELKRRITQLCELIAWDELDELRKLLSSD